VRCGRELLVTTRKHGLRADNNVTVGYADKGSTVGRAGNNITVGCGDNSVSVGCRVWSGEVGRGDRALRCHRLRVRRGQR
jgi:hypothetical protein